jgi:hypothetical protein
MNPNYRVVTYSPNGLTNGFKEYLNLPASVESSWANRDAIAITLLSIFLESSLPFCGAVITWSTSNDEAVSQQHMTSQKLSKLKCMSGNHDISVEGYIFHYGDAWVGIHGIYPFADVSQIVREDEYRKISFSIQQEKIKHALDQIYSNVLNEAIADGNELGFIACILANDDVVAQVKIMEIYNLLV